EIAAALHQTKAARIVDTVAADGETLRVVQRAPDPFAIAGMDGHAVGVVQLPTIVRARPGLVGTGQVHAGQRRDAELLDALAQVNLRLHVQHAVTARLDLHAIGTGGARRVEQRIDHQAAAIRLRLLDPEFGETRKLLTRRQRGVDGQTACG